MRVSICDDERAELKDKPVISPLDFSFKYTPA